MTADDIGRRLREVRLERGLSLRSLAQTLGVSASLISQVETGKTQPSVSTLFAMVTQLGMSLDEFLSPDGATSAIRSAPVQAGGSSVVQRSAENPVLEMENGVRWERLAVGPGRPADVLLVTYAPGASSSVEGKLMRHAGFEYAYMLEGELTLQLEFDTFVLRAGDSLQFDSVRPHMFSNNGTSVARGVWFVIGRHEQNLEMPAVDGEDARPAGISSAVDVLRAMDGLAD
ncbi:MAG: XRE family transcriptional regulator [Gemmatimonadota bacterium]|nr:XRE family transcriptional regulator [Gemmatimonadota bacterium]